MQEKLLGWKTGWCVLAEVQEASCADMLPKHPNTITPMLSSVIVNACALWMAQGSGASGTPAPPEWLAQDLCGQQS